MLKIDCKFIYIPNVIIKLCDGKFEPLLVQLEVVEILSLEFQALKYD